MQFLTTDQLADRWGLSASRIKQWRVDGKGPSFVRLGDGPKAPVRYRLEDIEEYEKDRYYSAQ